MDIEAVKEFINDENKWYNVIMPGGTSREELVAIKEIFANSGIKGTCILTTKDIKFVDITEYIKEFINKE